MAVPLLRIRVSRVFAITIHRGGRARGGEEDTYVGEVSRPLILAMPVYFKIGPVDDSRTTFAFLGPFHTYMMLAPLDLYSVRATSASG